ncbi:hypothetical protein PYCCODRAFT_1423177 [Trametes coccinea BRFM310]|uniref:Uncharacterized protein n=1 Tax=Trametes coccinea (strain BRFM310) TaxID=1353009 RepID=A0A1Y2IZL2_TRAC3|nr:hypothetical protein PYCCODRAFT_1423177 [Trametes coccinea BRFM310]
MAILNTQKTPTKSTPTPTVRFVPGVKNQLTIRASSFFEYRAPSPFPFRRPRSRHVKKYVAGRKAPVKVRLARRRCARRSSVKKGSVGLGGQTKRALELDVAGERIVEGRQPNQAHLPLPVAEGLRNRMNNLLAGTPADPISWPVNAFASFSG